MDVLAKADGLATLVSTRLEHVCGPDALWMARRRGHKPVVKFLMTLPEIQQALEVFEKEHVIQEAARKKAIEEAKQRAAEEKARREEEERQRLLEEKKRKEKEKAQRKMRADITEFDSELRAWKKDLADPELLFKQSETGYKKAMDELNDLADKLRSQTNKSKHMRSQATVHEVEAEMKKPEGVLEEIEFVIEQYKKLWGYSKELEDYKTKSLDTQWSELNCEELEEGAKQIGMKIKKINKMAKGSDVRRGVAGAALGSGTASSPPSPPHPPQPTPSTPLRSGRESRAFFFPVIRLFARAGLHRARQGREKLRQLVPAHHELAPPCDDGSPLGRAHQRHRRRHRVAA